MTTQEFKNVAKSKLEKLTDNQLIEECVKLNEDLSDVSSVLIEVILDILESRMKESEFIKLCEEKF